MRRLGKCRGPEAVIIYGATSSPFIGARVTPRRAEGIGRSHARAVNGDTAGSVPSVGRRGEAGVDRGIRRRFRDGDPEAVRLVYRVYGRLVYASAYRVLRDAGLAEEATQQTFVKAWRAADSLDENREMAPWLATIARRVAIDVQRSEARRSADPLESVPPADPALTTQPQSAEALHGVWEVRRALDELPPDEQEVIRLQHFEELTHTEIAERHAFRKVCCVASSANPASRSTRWATA